MIVKTEVEKIRKTEKNKIYIKPPQYHRGGFFVANVMV